MGNALLLCPTRWASLRDEIQDTLSLSDLVGQVDECSITGDVEEKIGYSFLQDGIRIPGLGRELKTSKFPSSHRILCIHVSSGAGRQDI